MSLKDVKPGSYRAKAVQGAWGESPEKKTPLVGVQFEFQCEGRMETIWHTMYLTQTQLKDGSTVAQKTFETLAKLGYDESKDLIKDEKGNPWFNKQHLADKEVEIVIEIEKGDDGKSYHKVRWVNELGGARVAGLPVAQVLGNMNLKSEMAAARARLGTSAPKPKTEAKQQSSFTEADIPF